MPDRTIDEHPLHMPRYRINRKRSAGEKRMHELFKRAEAEEPDSIDRAVALMERLTARDDELRHEIFRFGCRMGYSGIRSNYRDRVIDQTKVNSNAAATAAATAAAMAKGAARRRAEREVFIMNFRLPQSGKRLGEATLGDLIEMVEHYDRRVENAIERRDWATRLRDFVATFNKPRQMLEEYLTEQQLRDAVGEPIQ